MLNNSWTDIVILTGYELTIAPTEPLVITSVIF